VCSLRTELFRITYLQRSFSLISFRFIDMPHSSGLSRHDTLPAEDPSWSYSPVPGQPAPIPPRNEPLLFIPNHIAHHDTKALCLKNLPLPAAISEGNPCIETLMTSSTHRPPDHSDQHAVTVLNFHHVCSPLIHFPSCFTISKGPKLSGLDGDILPLTEMASLTIDEPSSLQADLVLILQMFY